MKLLDATQIKLERVDLTSMTHHPWQPYIVPPNTVGVASIIRAIAVKLGKYTRDDERDEISLRMIVGMGWEAMCAQFYPNMHWQPDVLELDGICGHMDGVSVLGMRYAVNEFKYTAKSIRIPGGKDDQWKDIRDEWVWNCQVMAYCKMFGELIGEEVNLGWFHVLWSMGNYSKFTKDEIYMRYLVEYEPDEIERNWQMLLSNRKLV